VDKAAAVSLKPLHGYGVLSRIRQISKDALEIPLGSLYPALYRLEHHGLITAEWGQSENNRRATRAAAGFRRRRRRVRVILRRT
jgi:PadR family transcriptional regulator, regulatory protein PadR